MILENCTLTITRREPGALVHGRWVPGAEVTPKPTMKASIQPASPTLLQSLPEGRQEYVTYLLFTEERLQQSDKDNNLDPDRVECDQLPGQIFEVFTCKPWFDDIVGNYETVIQAVHS